MRTTRSWLALFALTALAAQAAVVYKWTDDKGVVHYSDQPVPGAERIVTSGRTTQGITTGLGAPANPAAKKPPAAAGAASFVLISPTPEQTFFGDEPIQARVRLEPPPNDSQTIRWNLSGRDVAAGPADTQITLPHLDRGTYTISATLFDQSSGATQSTDTVTFYVHQPSLLSPQHKRP